MNILLAVHHYPPHRTGGAELIAQRSARWLAAQGHTVRVVTVGNPADPKLQNTLQVEEQVCDSVRVQRISFNWWQAPKPFEWTFDNPLLGEHFDSLVRAERPDLVHLISGYLVGINLLDVARARDIPSIVTLTDFWSLCPTLQLLRADGTLCPGSDPFECVHCMFVADRRNQIPSGAIPTMTRIAVRGLAAIPSLGQRFETPERIELMKQRQPRLIRAINSADAIISPTRFLANLHIQAGVNVRDCTITAFSVPPLPELDRTALSEQVPLRIGYLGQIVPIKGVDVLIRAFRKLNRSKRRAQLSIHGSLSAEPVYVQHLRKLAEGDPDIALADRYEHNQLAQILRDLDIVVVPSIWYENAPHVISEAFAAKRPVVATDLGGMSEIVANQVNGLLFARGDASDLARQLQRVLDEPGLIPQLQQGIPPIRSLEEEMTELMRVYERVLAKRHREI